MDNKDYQKDPSFWQSPFRLIQPNLRKIDAKGLNVRALVDQIVDYGANAVLVNGGGIVAWYPTDHPYQVENEFMEGDFLGEILQAAHDKDLRVLVRMDVSKSFPHVLEEHPDWFRRDLEGNVKKHWEMVTTCPTGPYWQEYNFEVIGELLSKYPIDGIFFNAFNYLSCHCSRCQQLFKETTGFELPAKEDWESPAWRAYVQYRYDQHADYNRRLAEFIAEKSPGTVLTIDTNITTDTYRGIRDSGWYTPQFAESNACITSEAFNFLDRPYPKWIHWAGEEVKMGNHIKHTSIILSYSKSIFSRRAAQPAAQIGYDMMQIAANGGSPSIAFSGAFDQNDKQGMPMIKKVMNYLKDNEQEYADMEPLADVAIIYSQRTADYYGKDYAAGWQHHYRGMYEMLVESHIPFTVMHEGSMTLEKLKVFKCVVLPNIAALSDEEAEMIDQYVAEGGHIISTFETGLYDGEGRPRQLNALKSINRKVVEKKHNAFTYLAVSDQQLISSYPDTDIVMFEGDFVLTELASSDNVVKSEDLHGIPAVLNTTPEFSYWDEVSDTAGLVVQEYGQGTVAYLPWRIDQMYHLQGVPEYKSIISALVKQAVGSLSAEAEAPAAVELLVANRKQGGRLVHLLNAIGTQGKLISEIVNISNISVKVKGSYTSARSLVDGTSYEMVQDGQYTRIHIPSLSLYDAIVVQ